MGYLFTSESVSEGHPDKVADQISDAVLDKIIAFDPDAKVACETLVTTGQTIVAGEIKTEAYVDVQRIAREVINRIGYTKSEYMFDGNSCGVLSAIHEQSPDIRKEGQEMTYLRPDSKSQVTIEYGDDNKPARIHTIVISTQHDEFVKATASTPEAQLEADAQMVDQIRWDIINILLPRVKRQLPERVQALFDEDLILHVNPTGKFVIGGPHGDTGLTGRKIIVDTYGGKGAHGGGAFSGKDPSKVDRSAAYAARHIAKNMVAAGIADEILIQISYAIGIARPVGVFVNTYGTAKVNLSDAAIAEKITSIFDLRPKAIEERLKLRNPIYQETASYGHMGRTPRIVKKVFSSNYWPTIEKEVELFTWEKLDYIEKIKEAFK